MSEKYVAQDQNPKLVRVNYTGNSSLTTVTSTYKTQEDNNGLPVVVDSYDRTATCIDIFTGCMPPKTT